ncbi:MAG: hypothetical protein MUP60_04505, partial [Candidatus Thorarchaeota archaeon]|nr:hypothetical protein [Candidatus Thorarchaeota archaeon]
SLYFDILTDLEIRHNNPLQKSDWYILTRMSDRGRLWYVTGVHMAQVIEQNLGLETLIETIRIGPDGFFKTYHDSL